MLKTLLIFYLKLYLKWIRESWSPSWRDDRRSDPQHFHGRRFTAKYRRKQEIVKSLWIVFGIISLSFPTPPLVIGLALVTTFVSFMILDETP